MLFGEPDQPKSKDHVLDKLLQTGAWSQQFHLKTQEFIVPQSSLWTHHQRVQMLEQSLSVETDRPKQMEKSKWVKTDYKGRLLLKKCMLISSQRYYNSEKNS